jgi:hypothetical protein
MPNSSSDAVSPATSKIFSYKPSAYICTNAAEITEHYTVHVGPPVTVQSTTRHAGLRHHRPFKLSCRYTRYNTICYACGGQAFPSPVSCVLGGYGKGGHCSELVVISLLVSPQMDLEALQKA